MMTKIGINVGEKIEEALKKKENEKKPPTFEEKVAESWVDSIQKLRSGLKPDSDQDNEDDDGCFLSSYCTVRDAKNRNVVREVRMNCKVSSDMRKYQWLIVNWESWNNMKYFDPRFERNVKDISFLGVGVLMKLEDFESSLQFIEKAGGRMIWRNKFDDKDNILIVEELNVVRKSDFVR